MLTNVNITWRKKMDNVEITFEYKSFKGKVYFNEKENIWCGYSQQIINTFTFYANTLEQLLEEFKISVEDYIEFTQLDD